MDRIVMQGEQKYYFKHFHSGIRTVKVAACIATTIFNEGHAAILKIMNVVEIRIGSQEKQFADSYDAEFKVKKQKLKVSD